MTKVSPRRGGAAWRLGAPTAHRTAHPAGRTSAHNSRRACSVRGRPAWASLPAQPGTRDRLSWFCPGPRARLLAGLAGIVQTWLAVKGRKLRALGGRWRRVRGGSGCRPCCHGAAPLRVQEAVSARKSELAVWLREGLVRLGPTFIKVGQQFSTRVDVLAPEFIKELEKLQVSPRWQRRRRRWRRGMAAAAAAAGRATPRTSPSKSVAALGVPAPAPAAAAASAARRSIGSSTSLRCRRAWRATHTPQPKA